MRTVAIVSGGMDSTTLAYQLKEAGDELYMLSFNYGQKHAKELDYAMRTSVKLGIPWNIVDLEGVGSLLGSSLTLKDAPIPEGHYASENMKATVVPNRNAIMLSIATGVACSLNADRVAFAAHAGDHPIYPDCRPEFVESFTQMAHVANEGFIKPNFEVFAPYIDISKADIVSIGAQLHLPYEQTWSCYVGGDVHCGRCGTCVERKEAFRLSKVIDPTRYADEVYEIAAFRG